MYKLGANEINLIQAIIRACGALPGVFQRFMRRGYDLAKIEDTIRHANYYSHTNNLDFFYVLEVTIRSNCQDAKGLHKHAPAWEHAYVTDDDGFCIYCGQVGSYVHTKPEDR